MRAALTFTSICCFVYNILSFLFRDARKRANNANAARNSINYTNTMLIILLINKYMLHYKTNHMIKKKTNGSGSKCRIKQIQMYLNTQRQIVQVLVVYLCAVHSRTGETFRKSRSVQHTHRMATLCAISQQFQFQFQRARALS